MVPVTIPGGQGDGLLSGFPYIEYVENKFP
jgi:hypothetical protein